MDGSEFNRVGTAQHFYVASPGFKIIGCIEMTMCPNKYAYLGRLKVARYFRRQGLGEKLVKFALKKARKCGVEMSFAVTFSKAAAGLMKKLGAKEVTRERMLLFVPPKLINRYGFKHKYWVFVFN